jgi:putative membrane protein
MKSFDPATIDRPDPALFRYYLAVSLLSGPLTPFVLLPLWFRYATLRYKFDEDGVSMCWGILFRREIYLTYRRIQDIHLTRNLLQRWMGLAKISVQTASGNSQAEMTIEGILEAEELRDFLYSQMRGARGDKLKPQLASADSSFQIANDSAQFRHPEQCSRAYQLLEEIRDALVRVAGAGPQNQADDQNR